MIKNLKNKKKKGFTLVELVVVIAIIAILAAVLIPQITGFIKDAKRTDIIEQARKVITVSDSVNAKYGSSTIKGDDVSTDIIGKPQVLALLDVDATTAAEFVDKIKTADLDECRKIVQTDKFMIEMNDADEFTSVTPTATATPTP
ncbi:MAG: prepilin-type N-terminal cleavage/methylation domain-containing protein [Clostridium sp.]